MIQSSQCQGKNKINKKWVNLLGIYMTSLNLKIIRKKKCSFPIELMDFAMEDNSLFFGTLFS